MVEGNILMEYIVVLSYCKMNSQYPLSLFSRQLCKGWEKKIKWSTYDFWLMCTLFNTNLKFNYSMPEECSIVDKFYYVNFLYLLSLYTSYNCLGSYSTLNFMVNDSNPLGDLVWHS